jgi:hypothetical protein
MSPARRRMILAALMLTCATAPAIAVTSLSQRHWRRHNGVPPLPFPELLHPQDQLPLPSGFTMTLVHGAEAAPDASATLERPRDVARRLSACWSPPAVAGDPAQVTVRLQFSKSGQIIGEPRFTYVSAGTSDRGKVLDSMRQALQQCVPLRFTASLGAAIAGYPFAIRFISDRRKD